MMIVRVEYVCGKEAWERFCRKFTDCQFDGNFLLIAPTSYVSGYYTSRVVLLRAVYRGRPVVSIRTVPFSAG